MALINAILLNEWKNDGTALMCKVSGRKYIFMDIGIAAGDIECVRFEDFVSLYLNYKPFDLASPELDWFVFHESEVVFL